MTWQQIIVPLSLGLFSSGHCLAMCGPLAMALPTAGQSSHTKGKNRLIYTAGRLSSYTLFGLLVGAFGQSINWLPAQKYLAFLATVGILLVFFYKYFKYKNVFSVLVQKLINQHIGKLYAKSSTKHFYVFGLAHGLLPCAVVYTALAGAALSPSVWAAAFFMFLFGLGTSPSLFLAISFKATFQKYFGSFFVRWQPAFMILFVFFILLKARPLQYLNSQKASIAITTCHQP
jgi:uncharacterized protein